MVFPGQKSLKFTKHVIPAVERALRDAFLLFCGKHIQNNWSETTNNVMRSVMCLTGMPSIEHLRRRIRSLFAIRNDASAIPHEVLAKRHNVNIILNRMLGKARNNKKVDYKIVMTQNK